MTASDFSIETDRKSGHLRLIGVLDLYHAEEAERLLKKALSGSIAILDVSGLTKLDTVGALLLRAIQEKYKQIRIEHVKPEHAALFDLVSRVNMPRVAAEEKVPTWKRAILRVGKRSIDACKAGAEFVTFLGRSFMTLIKAFRSPKHLRIADIMHHIETTGIYAIPIISLMAFMIAVVLAYQGVAQLQPLGAESLTVNLVAISVLREMGVLLTAIMVAGRSGSSFTAEIGVMKVREEVDALQVIGINPYEVLVIPRMIALLITLPLLTFIADAMGLLGGGVMSFFLIDLPFATYMQRVRAVADGYDFAVGMIKAPVFAIVIAIVGCMHGMKVSGSAESVGTETTASVVKSIFLVLGADAIFSVIFEQIGI
jgi:phospholipid/cholesterol/gamma-HCH transport system permease protein